MIYFRTLKIDNLMLHVIHLANIYQAYFAYRLDINSDIRIESNVALMPNKHGFQPSILIFLGCYFTACKCYRL
jgi:hypothetical protein